MDRIFCKIPESDFWFLDEVAGLLRSRLCSQNDSQEAKRGLFRFLFGIQSLPVLYPSTTIGIDAGHYRLDLSIEGLLLAHFSEDGHETARQMFDESGSEFRLFGVPEKGEEKKRQQEYFITDLEQTFEESCIAVENYSKGEPGLPSYYRVLGREFMN